MLYPVKNSDYFGSCMFLDTPQGEHILLFYTSHAILDWQLITGGSSALGRDYVKILLFGFSKQLPYRNRTGKPSGTRGNFVPAGVPV